MMLSSGRFIHLAIEFVCVCSPLYISLSLTSYLLCACIASIGSSPYTYRQQFCQAIIKSIYVFENEIENKPFKVRSPQQAEYIVEAKIKICCRKKKTIIAHNHIKSEQYNRFPGLCLSLSNRFPMRPAHTMQGAFLRFW